MSPLMKSWVLPAIPYLLAIAVDGYYRVPVWAGIWFAVIVWVSLIVGRLTAL